MKVEFINPPARVLEFVDETEDGFIASSKVTNNLSGRLRLHLFEFEAVLAENRLREVVEARLTLLTPVLLSVFAGRSLTISLLFQCTHVTASSGRDGDAQNTARATGGTPVLTVRPSLGED